jgi:hypothetical protein
MDSIDISKLDKAEVLAALFNNSRQQGFGLMNASGRNLMSVEEARNILKDQTYFDYLRGRVMKIDLGGDELSVGLYDRDNGQGAAEAALNTLTPKN